MGIRGVIVVGGGPAGMMAAGQAAAMGARTLLLEKMPRPGRKLAITGKGRCNLTNVASTVEFVSHFGPTGPFLRQAFHRFSNNDLVAFFEGQGVPTVVGVVVESLLTDGRQVRGIRDAGGKEYPADAVIIATGGMSYPATGSTGDGYRLAVSVGHAVASPRPALVPLETKGDVAPRLQGLSLRNVNVTMLVEGKKRAEAFGEMLFTHFGLSGPVILTLSGEIADVLDEGKKVAVSIDLKPALDERAMDGRLLREFDLHGKRKFETLLKGLLPAKLIPLCAEQVHIPPDRRGHQITAEERGRLRGWLKGVCLEVTGVRPIAEAIVTAGGIDTNEIDPRTMASRRMEGLFFAGEVMDVDADTGGYNLQAAFSTGWLAGRSAAEGGEEQGRVWSCSGEGAALLGGRRTFLIRWQARPSPVPRTCVPRSSQRSRRSPPSGPRSVR